MRSELTVREILQSSVLSCSPQTPLAEAARRMTDAQCSSILVVEAGKAVGIWTEQDALALDHADPGQYAQPVGRHMSSPVSTLPLDATLGEAALRFREEGVRHFLVVDAAGGQRGIVSQSDIVVHQGIEYFVSLRELESVFTRQFLTVAGALPLREAVAEMHRHRLDAVVVEGADGRHGILTERDVVRLVSAGRPAGSVEEVASFPLLSLPLSTPLFHARKEFLRRRVRHLGVTDGDKLVGLVTFAGILANIEHEYVRHLREALRESEASLAHSNHRLRLAAKAFENTFEGILVTNADSIIESVNPAFTQITGYRPEEVVGKKPSLLASGRHDDAFYKAMYEALDRDGHWQGEICNRRRNGEIYVEWVNINTVRDEAGRVVNYVAVFTDFTSRKAVEEQMRHLAQHDALTGLANRTLLTERLARAILHARRNGRKLAVLFLDLNDFKAVNDNFGHDAGDEMLRVTARRLADCLRAEDTVARLGGDEFVILIEELAGAEPVAAVAGKLIAAVAQPVAFAGRAMLTACSIGVSLYPDDASDPDGLIRLADAAMYLAKEEGSNTCRFFGEPRD